MIYVYFDAVGCGWFVSLLFACVGVVSLFVCGLAVGFLLLRFVVAIWWFGCLRVVGLGFAGFVVSSGDAGLVGIWWFCGLVVYCC